MNILLTGGMGFIGSHTAVVLIEAGHDVVLFDNLSNADRSVLDRIETITGRRPVFIEGDIRDAAAMEKALDGVDAVIHFAGLKAVPYIMNHTGWIAINLGCGRGYSVLEVVKAFEKASDRSVPYELVDRREGDIAANWCDPARAERLLGWKASRTIDDMCRDAWNFESNKR